MPSRMGSLILWSWRWAYKISDLFLGQDHEWDTVEYSRNIIMSLSQLSHYFPGLWIARFHVCSFAPRYAWTRWTFYAPCRCSDTLWCGARLASVVSGSWLCSSCCASGHCEVGIHIESRASASHWRISLLTLLLWSLFSKDVKSPLSLVLLSELKAFCVFVTTK